VELLLSILMKTISTVMLVVFILSVVMLILTFRKPRKVSILSIAITIATSLATLAIFSTLIRYEPPAWLWLLMTAAGIATGLFWARTTNVFVQGNQVMSQNSILYLVVWGGIFTANQLIIIFTNRPPAIAMALLIVSTATVWGTNANILWRYSKVQANTGRSGGEGARP
jgi:hypothetical protein